MYFRKAILLIASLLLSSALWAQQDTTVAPQQDTTIVPSSNDTGISSEINQLQIKYKDTTLQRLLGQLKQVNDNERQNSTAIQGLLQGKQIDNMTKYKLLKSNLINAVQTYYLLNKKVIDLKSRNTSNSLDVFITSLNNPESKALGFSFSERVISLVKSVILGGKADKTKRGQEIISTTESILNSPIFRGFTTLAPPLGIATSLMTFFHTLSINNKSINQKSLKDFEVQLNKYVAYYTALNEGNQKFQYGLSYNKDQLNTLQQNLYNNLAFTASALGFTMPPKDPNEPLGVTLNKFFLNFNQSNVEKYFDQLEHKYTIPGTDKINYERLLRENMSLKEANNQLEDLVMQTKNFENLYGEYFTMLDNYYGTVISAMNIANTNGLADKAIVQEKQQEFTELKKEAVSDTKTSIDIGELKNSTDNIKYRYKIF
ncbi:MAG: hypothetical protein EPN39_19285 [Chitinophagaceae bacterium]|nr:MAG: hypothetical protein EPN39_19285 [Chitinophagaceae bacterium]